MQDNTEFDVSDKTDNVEIILVRMEGKLDRMNDRMIRYEADHQGLRARVHELANDLTPILMLNLADRFRAADAETANMELRLKQLEIVEQQRTGAAKLAKILWVLVGAVGVSGAAAILRILQVGL